MLVQKILQTQLFDNFEQDDTFPFYRGYINGVACDLVYGYDDRGRYSEILQIARHDENGKYAGHQSILSIRADGCYLESSREPITTDQALKLIDLIGHRKYAILICGSRTSGDFPPAGREIIISSTFPLGEKIAEGLYIDYLMGNGFVIVSDHVDGYCEILIKTSDDDLIDFMR